MNKEELYEYIKNKKCYCVLCSELKERVLKYGVEEIKKYDGFICGGIDDMVNKYHGWEWPEVKTKKLNEDDFWDLFDD